MRDKAAEKAVSKLVDEFIRIRKESGLSHDMLAEAAGVHRSTISLIESKKRIPTILTCWRIAGALKVKLSAVIKQAED